MKYKQAVAILIVIIIGFSIVPGADQKLRYQYQKGKSYQYIITSDMASESEAMGQPINVTAKNYLKYTLIVDDINSAGNFVCTARIDSFDMKMDSPMMPGNLPDPKEFVGKRVSVTINNTGKVIEAAALDKFSPPAGAMMGRTPEGMLKEAYFTPPEQEVETNVPWKSTKTDTINQPMMGFPILSNTESEYTIIGNETVGKYDCLKIAINSKSKRSGSGTTSQGMDLGIDAKGTTTGFIYFAMKEGIVVKMDTTTDMESVTSVTAPQAFTSTTISKVKATMELAQ
ncbi:MAG: hypothetical protein V1799_03025 [bacterium]